MNLSSRPGSSPRPSPSPSPSPTTHATSNQSDATPSGNPPRVKKFWAWRDLPSFIWLIAAVVCAVGHRWLPEPRWLLIHLVLLGAASHAILVWSQHFSFALLHTPVTTAERLRQSWRLGLFNGGVVVVFVGVLSTLWVVALCGAVLISGAVVWHAASLLSRFRKAVGVRFAVTIWYYVAASISLPVGATIGVFLSHGFADPLHGQLKTGHALINVLGWVGLTVVGTLVTLWPTMLRTKIHPDAVSTARRTLWVFVAALVVASISVLLGNLWGATAGILLYLVALCWLCSVFLRTARQRPPSAFCTFSVAAGLGWLVFLLACLLVGFTRGALGADDWNTAYASFSQVAPYLAAGFAAQVLIGALAYLIPVMVSSGPASARAANQEMNRGSVFRILLTNLALALSLLPVPSVVLVASSMLYLGASASFLVLMVRSMRAAKRPRLPTIPTVPATSSEPAGNDQATGIPKPQKLSPYGESAPRSASGQAVAAVLTILLAVGAGVAVDPSALGSEALGNTSTAQAEGQQQSSSSQGSSSLSAPAKTLVVEAQDMKFFPNTLKVDAGTELTVELINKDTTNIHDLVFENGFSTGRIAVGETATIHLGVITESIDGWCSILGHKQMGMTLSITVAEADNASEAAGTAHTGQDGESSAMESNNATHNHSDSSDKSASSAANDLDFSAMPGDDFSARDALLGKLPKKTSDPVTRKLTFEITEQEMEIAPGVTQTLWTFNQQFPGPTLHGRVGDIFEITLVNSGSMGHSIDFHASNLAPNEPMRTIAPGESLTYTFTAERAGIWMYHCSTMPMTTHIANGMAGAVIIEPDDLPDVDRSYVIVQSEMYLGAQGEPVDVERALAGDSQLDAVVFNGYANQYVAEPLTATTGDRVRIWTLDVGPSRASSFHVVGGQFDRVWFEGAYTLGSATAPAAGSSGGSQALAMQPAQGGFVELTFPEAGTYPFVTHIMADAERGAKGLFEVTD